CGKWIKYYNEERPHQELGNLSPDEWLAEQLKSPFIGEGAVREERAEAPPSPRAPSLRSEPLGEGGRKKRLDTDDRKCNNIFSPVSLTKKSLLGVEKGGVPP
ncbi:MAG: integrase core domain-containing protein, partial [Akkermansia sp.]|nr:integrase core domain-containing protein [Akkermansia sp.]